MAERLALTQAVQLGVETTPGTGVPANKLLNSLGVDSGMKFEFNKFRPTGQKFESIVNPGKEWVELKLTGSPSYSEMIYLLSSALVATTGVIQGATTAYKWTFTPNGRSADTVKTFTIEQGDATHAQKFAYGIFSELGISFDRSGLQLTGAGFAQAIQDGITLTAAPTAIEEQPILAKQVDVFMDGTSAGIGTTKLLRAIKGELMVKNRFSPLWVLNSANGSFAAHVEVVPEFQLKLMLEADAQGMALLTTARAGSTQYLRVACTSDQLAGTAIPYSMNWDLAGKVADVSQFEDNEGVYAVEWTFDNVYDPAWASGQAMSVAVINKQTAL